MLLNMLGVGGDDAVRLAAHEEDRIDPKARLTLTGLVEAVLASFMSHGGSETPDAAGAAAPSASLTRIAAQTPGTGAQRDAA